MNAEPSDLLKRLSETAARLKAVKAEFARDFTACVKAGYLDPEIARVLGISKEAVRTRRGRLGLEKEKKGG